MAMVASTLRVTMPAAGVSRAAILPGWAADTRQRMA